MREILFRGQLRRKGEKVNMAGEPLPSIWKYGGCAQYGGGAVIYQAEPEIKKSPVYADTVGQYTGLTDKNGVKIFENGYMIIDNKTYKRKTDSMAKKEIVEQDARRPTATKHTAMSGSNGYIAYTCGVCGKHVGRDARYCENCGAYFGE